MKSVNEKTKVEILINSLDFKLLIIKIGQKTSKKPNIQQISIS